MFLSFDDHKYCYKRNVHVIPLWTAPISYLKLFSYLICTYYVNSCYLCVLSWLCYQTSCINIMLLMSNGYWLYTWVQWKSISRVNFYNHQHIFSSLLYFVLCYFLGRSNVEIFVDMSDQNLILFFRKYSITQKESLGNLIIKVTI